MMLCKIDLNVMARKLDAIENAISSSWFDANDSEAAEVKNRVKQFRKCVDCPNDNDEFFCMCDCGDRHGHEVAFAAVNPDHGPKGFVYVHSITTIERGKYIGVELIRQLRDYYKKPLWMQCRPIGAGTVDDPYMVNNELLYKFYRRNCREILTEMKIDKSVWGCTANFFYTCGLTVKQVDDLYSFLYKTYGISNPSHLDDPIHELTRSADEVNELKSIISEFVGKTISDELKDEMAKMIVNTAIKYHGNK